MNDPFEYIRTYYGVPAERGRRVNIGGLNGVITKAINQYIEVHFDGEKKPRGPFHPTSEVTYLGMGKVPKMTRAQERYRRYREAADCFDSFAQFLKHEKDERAAKRLGFAHAGEYRNWRNRIKLA